MAEEWLERRTPESQEQPIITEPIRSGQLPTVVGIGDVHHVYSMGFVQGRKLRAKVSLWMGWHRLVVPRVAGVA